MVKERIGSSGQQGFTLIEIIAVLVILGILAVVAVPKYFSLQSDARKAAAMGLITAAQSQLSLGYATSKLNSSYSFSSASTECNKVAISGNASLSCSGSLTNNVAITGTVEGESNTGYWNNPESL